MEVLRESDFMLLPSIREFGGGVVIEAMASATTPIVANYAGPGELVDNSTGLRIPFSDRQSLIDGMREAIDRLVAHPETLCALGIAARTKVLEKLTWEAKADQIHQVYQLVLRGGPVEHLRFF
jgi:glycosyltransferase involved in cell wall biosynthesis